uniref:Uncharacterized protein n=1 Tax=Eutreptiella gymnastica TaxID=73025 RepID=A0A7S1IEZ9_9EUGL|mmetsp:Transcript_151378/g.264467  ORF Transcript_151378/g.264467 Transcript_151378/m.264467 type:complete len:113 (+) Transcript_151378:499-837(+)
MPGYHLDGLTAQTRAKHINMPAADGPIECFKGSFPTLAETKPRTYNLPATGGIVWSCLQIWFGCMPAEGRHSLLLLLTTCRLCITNWVLGEATCLPQAGSPQNQIENISSSG